MAGQGFGGAAAAGTGSTNKKKRKQKPKKKQKSTTIDTSFEGQQERKRQIQEEAQTLHNQQQEELQRISNFAQTSSQSILGQAVSTSKDEFWNLMPSLISSKFPQATDEDLRRVAGFLRHAVDPTVPLDEDIVQDPYRPHEEIHAYMPELDQDVHENGSFLIREPFLDPKRVELCQRLEENYEVISKEYEALVANMKKRNVDRFQSVTSMNYESGWKTMVLFYNGHRIPNFPYHQCPVTTSLLEEVPLAGRIAGFNRQQPQTGIPLHSDGNNMWLTCQMGIKVPEGNKARITVGDSTRHWSAGQCLLYDTTFQHETFNESPDEERVVLHVDFFNTLAMTSLEIEVMQYVYEMREKFLKAEGVAKVGAHIL